MRDRRKQPLVNFTYIVDKLYIKTVKFTRGPF